MKGLCVIILTYNEELHITRVLQSLKAINPIPDIYVIDSGSTDNTVQLAESFGVTVLHRKWKNYSDQFNWGIDQVRNSYRWIFRIDADEFIDKVLAEEISRATSHAENYLGFFVYRNIKFCGHSIRYGFVNPTKQLRLFDSRKSYCENTWMDEHIICEKPIGTLKGRLIDDNRQTVDWWIQKHNKYASREAIDILLEQNGSYKTNENLVGLNGVKRVLKKNLYLKFPSSVRAWIYFALRYCVGLGFLDSRFGRQYHFMQGLWYRQLVDLKVSRVIEYQRKSKSSLEKAIRDVLELEVIT